MRIVLVAVIAAIFSLIEYGTHLFPYVPITAVVFSCVFAGVISRVFRGAEFIDVLFYAVAVSIALAYLCWTPDVEPVKVMLGLWTGANALWATVVGALLWLGVRKKHVEL